MSNVVSDASIVELKVMQIIVEIGICDLRLGSRSTVPSPGTLSIQQTK
jgi:hypothetical protein|tara:strand:- start:37072 stop:37215 length:144 start_codon:yes stop_codon:yes gene_type:complete